jgi:serine-type D-Ala-D-Ala carboxypeptidase/endopeptidase (penicillin-binding protein 4)
MRSQGVFLFGSWLVKNVLARRSRLSLSLVALLSVSLSAVSAGTASSMRGHALRAPKHVIAKRQAVAFAHKGANLFIDAWLARPELRHSQVGIELIDLNSGEELFSSNAQRRFTPASTAKVFVTACAYETLGPAYTYKTRLTTKGRLSADKLEGNVLVEPSQDPTLSRADLSQMLNTLHSRGLGKISGNFVQSEVPGGGERFIAEWLSEDWGQDWMPASSSFVVDRNVSSASFFTKTKFSVKGPSETNNALEKTLLKGDYTTGWLSADSTSHSISVYQPTDQSGSLALKVVANPDDYNIALLNNMADQLGIKVAGQKPWLSDLGTTTMLVEHQSMPLARILKTTLKESDNLYAEQLLRTLALSQANANPKTSLNLEQRGLQKLTGWLQSIGVPSDEIVLWDGCGLSRKDCVSPHALNLVLRHMALHPTTLGYLALLNQATVSPKGRFQFKTGAMDSVRGITGILENFEGKKFALTVLVNGHSPSVRDLRTSIGVLVNQLATARVDNLKGVTAKPQKSREQ